MQQQNIVPTDTTPTPTPPAIHHTLAVAFASVLDDPNLLHLIVQHLALSSHHTSSVSIAWRQVAWPQVAWRQIQRFVHDITSALESCSLDERGVQCQACDAAPEWVRQASCLSCGAPIVLRGLRAHQQANWDEFYRARDYEGFDTWFLFDNYRHYSHVDR